MNKLAKIWAICIVIVLAAVGTAAAEIDLDSMTEDELLGLRSEIDAKLSEMHARSGQVDVGATSDVLYEGHDCRLTLVSIDQKECQLLIENDSALDYGFSVRAFAINGIMTDSYARTDVSAHKKAYMTIEFDNWLMGYRPEGPYNNIQLFLWAYDNAKSFKDFETDVITIPIDASVTSNSFSMGTDVVEISGLSLSPIEFTDDSITIALVNNNDVYVDCDLEETSINGWSFGTGVSVYNLYVFPGCQAIFTIEFDSEFKKECKIDTVDSFEFKLDVCESGDLFKGGRTPPITFTK